MLGPAWASTPQGPAGLWHVMLFPLYLCGPSVSPIITAHLHISLFLLHLPTDPMGSQVSLGVI